LALDHEEELLLSKRRKVCMEGKPMPIEDLPIVRLRQYQVVEHSENRLIGANHRIKEIGRSGISNGIYLLGPVICYIPTPTIASHMFSPYFLRSAIDTSEGLGIVTFNADIVPFPKDKETWEDMVAHEDDVFTPYSKCSVLHRYVLLERIMDHLDQLKSAMKVMVAKG
jgi:hypothetical protein